MPLHVSNSSFTLVLHQHEWQQLQPQQRNRFLEDATGYSRASEKIITMDYPLSDPQLFLNVLQSCKDWNLSFGLMRDEKGGDA